MNTTQKGAWANIAGTILVFSVISYLVFQIGIRCMTPSRIGFYITLCAAVLITGISVGILYVIFGFPVAAAGMGFLGIAGICGLGPVIFKKDQGAVDCDERDILINRRAVNIGFVTAFLIVGLVCMLPFFILGSKYTISVAWLPMIFALSSLSSIYIHSIAILVQYGRRGIENE
jgi:hypothetical protein